MVTLEDTWVFDGDSWTELIETVDPASERAGHAMTYDPDTGRVTLSGGYDYGTTTTNRHVASPDDAIAHWNGVTWTSDLSPDGTCDEDNFGWGLAHDGRRVMRRGGTAAETCLLNTATNAWSRTASTNPTARRFGGLAYDRVRDRVFLYGGQLVSGGAMSGEVWSWDPGGSTWTLTHTDTARMFHAAAYDSLRGVVAFFGGVCTAPTTACSQFVVEYEATEPDVNGYSFTGGVVPPARIGAAVAYYEAQEAFVLVGGADPVTRHPLGDSWILRDSINRRPALVATVDFAAAQIDRAAVASLTVTSLAGGIGQRLVNGGYVAVNGAAIAAYDATAATWLELDDNTGAPTVPAALSATATDAAARALIEPSTNLIRVRLQPDGVQGVNAAPTASVQVDSIRVAVRYRRP